MSEHFYQLTPERVLDAVEVDGRRCTGRFLILNSFENRVYQLELDDGTMVVGKFYRPGRWSREAIEDEHRFLADLEKDEIPVARPLELGSQGTIGEVDGLAYCLFPRIGGRSKEELSDADLQVMGRLLARMHNIGASTVAKHRWTLSTQSYGHAPLERLLASGLIDPMARDQYESTVRILLERIEPMFQHVSPIRIHGDCHLSNLLWTDLGPTFLDFDDMLMGPPVQDVWMVVPSYDEEGRRQRNVLIEAYEQFRDFDHHQLQLIEALRALRFIHYSAWIAMRWQDPIFPRTFPYFGTLQYWQKEVQDLREQLARLEY